MARSRMRRSRPKGQPAERRDDRFKAFVRRLGCCAPVAYFDRHTYACLGVTTCGVSPCDPHHEHGDGLGMKTHDRTCVPLCRRHHDDCEAKRGPFKGWDRERMREWHRAESQRVVALYERSGLRQRVHDQNADEAAGKAPHEADHDQG